MNEKLVEAMDYISDAHIAEAAGAKKRHRKLWIGAAAAILVLVLLLNGPGMPPAVYAQTISQASGSRQPQCPDPGDYETHAEFQAAWQTWSAQREQTKVQADAALETLTPFFLETTRLYLSGSGGENRVWSPVNAYIALAMLSEITDGDSRQQILDALNTPDQDTLRTQAGAVWEAVYDNDGNEICLLANSLWLNDGLSYQQEAMDNVAYYHYASVYQTDFSSPNAGKALREWLDANTGGLLKEYIGTSNLSPDMVLSLVSTVYLQAKWVEEFNAANNTDETFHAPGGDITCTYMNKKGLLADYYWGESYGAVALYLKNGTQMWLILPDADKTPEDVLAEGEYLERILHQERNTDDNSKYMQINLSLPKFDISSGADAGAVFQSLGITDIFNLSRSNFTAITSDSPVFITAVNQAARVIVDEQGIKAASYLEFPGDGAAAPPEEIMDFILDRPFLFVIADNGGTPLFTGLVNNP